LSPVIHQRPYSSSKPLQAAKRQSKLGALAALKRDYGLTVMVTVAAAEDEDPSRALNVNESVPVKLAAGCRRPRRYSRRW
jgi:hypothetical protein